MDKKMLIFEAALKLFVENGFHGTATGKIAQEAGVATGTLFHYFKTKDELVIALYNDIKIQLANYLDANYSGYSGIRDIMKAQFVASLVWALENPVRFSYIQQVHHSPYLGQLSAGDLLEQVQPHLALIQKGIEEKLIKALPPDLIFSLISSHTFGLYRFLIAKQLPPEQQHQIIQTGFELLWQMLGPTPNS